MFACEGCRAEVERKLPGAEAQIFQGGRERAAPIEMTGLGGKTGVDGLCDKGGPTAGWRRVIGLAIARG